MGTILSVQVCVSFAWLHKTFQPISGVKIYDKTGKLIATTQQDGGINYYLPSGPLYELYAVKEGCYITKGYLSADITGGMAREDFYMFILDDPEDAYWINQGLANGGLLDPRINPFPRVSPFLIIAIAGIIGVGFGLVL